ncbi:cbb3-type cytochrome c oxidase subunit 3 [Pigmentiphaga aceris]|uniref:Cbb3-type cytochrome c oxidase subunit 3 n=1 Tax=Pigmentiphaga aceris TaxID=1940612 RepID=A0A5C0B613_9BURK|nr:cbb3-type cytochrome c oxidase subunit 3 [Pigmentiphaga aceris]QEI09133.1 cbb3-type cytochrome c oxidase subunit 3 [Pigmentiphaga aceris]
MDLNTLRSTVTVLAFACFIGIFLWAWSGRNRASFDEAGRLPFADDTRPAPDAGNVPNLRNSNHV